LLSLALAVALAAQAPAQALESQTLWSGLSYGTETIRNSAGKKVNTFIAHVNMQGTTLYFATGVPNDSAPMRPGVRQTVTEQAKAARRHGKNVVAAVNADFFYSDNRIPPQGLTIKDGETLVSYKSNGNVWFFGVLDDGTAVIGNRNDYNRVKDRLQQAVGGGDCLLKNGEAPYQYGGADPQPRTAVGIKADGSVLLVVADGRTSASAGLSLADLAAYMKSLGVVDALNLDGGGSSALVVKSPVTRRFETKNHPSGGAERAVGNTLLVIDSAPLTWLDKLPDSLTGICGLAPWLQNVIYYLFFGWVWDVI
jgi:uncharacterized protein YigE (DUF2233 family)